MNLNLAVGSDGKLVVTNTDTGTVIPADTLDVVNGPPAMLYLGFYVFNVNASAGASAAIPATPDPTPAPAPGPTPAPTPAPGPAAGATS